MFHVVLLNGFILNCFSVMCVNRMMFYICVTVHLLYISIYLSLWKRYVMSLFDQFLIVVREYGQLILKFSIQTEFNDVTAS